MGIKNHKKTHLQGSAEFAVYYDVTTKAKELTETQGVDGYYQNYEKVFVCRDTNNWWVAHILEGYNEDFEKEDGKFMLERNEIDFDDALTIEDALRMQAEDCSIWDNLMCNSLEEAIEAVEGGFRIIPDDLTPDDKNKKKKSTSLKP